MNKSTKRLKREQEIKEALDAGDDCFEKLKKKRTDRKKPKPGIQFKNLAEHKRTKTLFQALQEDDLSTHVNGNGTLG